ncbi:MAG: hypothetical protein GEV05_14945 [Betaproteobacteria bacterium]|nr:hypothetical protein [Betaproteobacteria bacterium]
MQRARACPCPTSSAGSPPILLTSADGPPCEPARWLEVQYALVGFALVAFFVLLLAFAEHIGFGLAYLIAAGACIALVGLYVRYVLGTRARAASLTGLLGGLYGALYMVLGSEDYALLMGALLLFAALAAFMLTTRRLDWYALSGHKPAG